MALLSAVAIVTTLALPAAAYPRPGRTHIASLATDGSQGDHHSTKPVLDATGRFVAFESSASNLAPANNYGIFLRDMRAGTTELVSVADDGTSGDGASAQFDMSADASRIVFRSIATDLVAGDGNGEGDIFVRDRSAETTVRVSVAHDGTEADRFSVHPRISADGSTVAFRSLASNLVPDDTNGDSDVFVYDFKSGAIERVSLATDGTQSEGDSFSANSIDMSADGRFVVFDSFAENLTPEDSNGSADVFVHDRVTGSTEKLSVATGGTQVSGDSRHPAMSEDGRLVAFVSSASGLVPHDTNGAADVFVHDRDSGVTRRISVSGIGGEANAASADPSFSGDGRFVAFHSSASNLVPSDTNGRSDVFVYDLFTRELNRASLSGDGAEATGTSTQASLSRAGESVAFISTASDLTSSDANGFKDVFVRSLGPTTGVGGMSLAPAAGSVSVTGWATFSGDGLSAKDGADDGRSGASSAGAELVGAGIFERPEAEDLQAVLEVSSAPGAPGTLYGFRFLFEENVYELRGTRSADGDRGALFRCTSSCERIEDVPIAIGATANEVIFSVPYTVLPAVAGSLTNIAAFTALGDVSSGSLSELDSVSLGDRPLSTPAVVLGIAEAGVPQSEVVFSQAATLADGSFSSEIDTTALPSGDYEVWAEACHAGRCGSASRLLAVDGGTAARRTEVSFTSATDATGQFSDQVTLQAQLRDVAGAAMAGEQLTFAIDGTDWSRSLETATGSDGLATVSPVLDGPPGRYRVTVSYAGTSGIEPSSAATNLELEREDTQVRLVAGADDDPSVLTARLSDLDSPATGIEGRKITFLRNDESLGSALTDAHGIATVEAAGPSGTARLTARFDGDTYYRAAADTIHPPAARTERVSVGAAGQGNEESNTPSRGGGLSAGGRFVAFHSFASNLVAGDTNGEWDVFVHDQQKRETQRVSVSETGDQGDADAFAPAITPDGRYVAFWSAASGLVSGDSNGSFDVFVRDMTSGSLQLVSVATDGTRGNNNSSGVDISNDGRFVLFESLASNLVEGDTNADRDVFVRDLHTGTTERVSVASDGTQANVGAFRASFSPDGRYVTFRSGATNLVADDTNGSWDVFLHDRDTGVTERVSVTNDGGQAEGGSDQSDVSADGRYVVFRSHAPNLVPVDTSASYDVFVRDRVAQRTERISVGTNGEAPRGNSIDVGISEDGRYVTFGSYASNLVAGDSNGGGFMFSGEDVFVHDRATRTTERVSVKSDGAEAAGGAKVPSIDPTGRFVAFYGAMPDMVPGDSNEVEDVFLRDRGPEAGVGNLAAELADGRLSVSGWTNFAGQVATADDPRGDGAAGADGAGAELIGARLVQRPELRDVLVRLDLASMPPAPGNIGPPGTLYGMSFTFDGSVYEVRANRSGSGSSFGLYRCNGSCVQTATLTGGIGTAGAEVIVSVPTEHLGATDGAVTDVTAFTAVPGTGLGGRLDEVSLPELHLEAPTVSLGIAPAGTPEREVTYSTELSLDGDSFSAEMPTGLLPHGDYEVWAKGCLGGGCGAVSTSFVIVPLPAEIAFTETSATQGQFSDEVSLRVRLSADDGSPLAGREVTLTLGDESSVRTFTGTTDDSGVAQVSAVLNELPGVYELSALFAGDDRFGAVTTTSSFEVLKEDSLLTLSSEGRGNSGMLVATLSDADTPARQLAGRTIAFYADDELLGSAETDEQGRATLTIPPGYRGRNRTYEAIFQGDTHYELSRGSTGHI